MKKGYRLTEDVDEIIVNNWDYFNEFTIVLNNDEPLICTITSTRVTHVFGFGENITGLYSEDKWFNLKMIKDIENNKLYFLNSENEKLTLKKDWIIMCFIEDKPSKRVLRYKGFK